MMAVLCQSPFLGALQAHIAPTCSFVITRESYPHVKICSEKKIRENPEQFAIHSNSVVTYCTTRFFLAGAGSTCDNKLTKYILAARCHSISIFVATEQEMGKECDARDQCMDQLCTM